MEQKTVNMIKFLKHHGGRYPSYREAAIAFMMDYSGCDRSVYTQDKIEEIIFEVFCDFIDACDKPSTHLGQMMFSYRLDSYTPESRNVFDYMLTAMVLCMVRERNGDGYVNGFKPEDFADEEVSI